MVDENNSPTPNIPHSTVEEEENKQLMPEPPLHCEQVDSPNQDVTTEDDPEEQDDGQSEANRIEENGSNTRQEEEQENRDIEQQPPPQQPDNVLSNDNDVVTAPTIRAVAPTAHAVVDTSEQDRVRIEHLERTIQEYQQRQNDVVDAEVVAETSSRAIGVPTDKDPSNKNDKRRRLLMCTGILGIVAIIVTIISVVVARNDDEPRQVWFQIGSDLDGEAADDYFGSSLAISSNGTTIVVGTERNDGNGEGSGHVRAFSWNAASGDWVQLGNDIDGENPGDESGRSVAMSADGTRIAIGAPSFYVNGSNTGHIRVFEWSESYGNWTQLGDDILGENIGDESGRGLAMSGDGKRVAMGADENNDNGVFAGHVRVFEWDGAVGEWLQVGSDVDSENPGDRFAFSVSMSDDGNRFVAFAPQNNDAGGEAGHARVFFWNGTGNWTQMGSDIDGEHPGDQLSTWGEVSMSGDGNRVAIGAPSNDDSGSDTGHVRVFEWNDDAGDWTQVGQDINGERPFDWLGKSVALSDDGLRVVVGAPAVSGAANATGYARVFDDRNGRWVQVGLKIYGEDEDGESGWRVGISGDGKRIIVGARKNDGVGGVDSGHARVYEVEVEEEEEEVS